MLTDEQLKDLRAIVGKAVGMDGPYTWGIDDYVAVAEHFYQKGQSDAMCHLAKVSWCPPEYWGKCRTGPSPILCPKCRIGWAKKDTGQ